MNKYIIYNEKNRVKGCVSAEFVAVAQDENHVIEMACENDVDLAGYTIELVKENVKNEMGKDIEAYFRNEY